LNQLRNSATITAVFINICKVRSGSLCIISVGLLAHHHEQHSNHTQQQQQQRNRSATTPMHTNVKGRESEV
jgi:hypothetical protein